MTPDDEQLARADAILAEVGSWVGSSQLPERPPLYRVEWSRQGLAAVSERLNVLATATATFDAWAASAAHVQALCSTARVIIDAGWDDVVADRLTAEVSTMAARGMAADERRIGHDTKAMPWTLRRRRLAQLSPSVDAFAASVRQTLYSLRDERSDLRAQLRAIDIAVQIGEL